MATTEGSDGSRTRDPGSGPRSGRQPDPAARFRRLPRTVQLTETVAVVGSLTLVPAVPAVPLGPEGADGD